jgi:hypothetical protein
VILNENSSPANNHCRDGSTFIDKGDVRIPCRSSNWEIESDLSTNPAESRQYISENVGVIGEYIEDKRLAPPSPIHPHVVQTGAVEGEKRAGDWEESADEEGCVHRTSVLEQKRLWNMNV